MVSDGTVGGTKEADGAVTVLPPRTFRWGYNYGYARARLPRRIGSAHRSVRRHRPRFLCGDAAATNDDAELPRCLILHSAVPLRPDARVVQQVPEHAVFAAGVLFYSRPEPGRPPEFLLGRECYYAGWADSNRWADTGGGVECLDRCVEDTAAREAVEEVMGTVASFGALRDRLVQHDTALVADVRNGCATGFYRVHLVQIEHRDYNDMLQRFRRYLRFAGVAITHAEKTELRWVPVATAVDMAYKCVGGETAQLDLRPNFAQGLCQLSRHVDLAAVL